MSNAGAFSTKTVVGSELGTVKALISLAHAVKAVLTLWTTGMRVWFMNVYAQRGNSCLLMLTLCPPLGKELIKRILLRCATTRFIISV